MIMLTTIAAEGVFHWKLGSRECRKAWQAVAESEDNLIATLSRLYQISTLFGTLYQFSLDQTCKTSK